MDKFTLNSNKILNYQLAFECYSDDVGNEPDLLLEIYKDITEYRNGLNNCDTDTNILKQEKIIKKCEKLLSSIGEEHFYLYDDENIEYKYDVNEIEK